MRIQPWMVSFEEFKALKVVPTPELKDVALTLSKRLGRSVDLREAHLYVKYHEGRRAEFQSGQAAPEFNDTLPDSAPPPPEGKKGGSKKK